MKSDEKFTCKRIRDNLNWTSLLAYAYTFFIRKRKGIRNQLEQKYILITYTFRDINIITHNCVYVQLAYSFNLLLTHTHTQAHIKSIIGCAIVTHCTRIISIKNCWSSSSCQVARIAHKYPVSTYRNTHTRRYSNT